jgi:NitT/TauT family transport system permease protein
MTDVAAALTPPRRRVSGRGARARLWGFGALGIIVLAAAWELYKALGPADGLVIAGSRVLPRTTDLAMPHLWEMAARLAEPVTRAPGARPLWLEIVLAATLTLGIAASGWVVGVIVGIGLALVMQRWRLAESAILPWIILSQTVPLIAFAPLVRSWGSRIEIGAFEWQDWMSVALIASYLAFFPVAVGALRGLQAPDAIHLELLRTYSVGWWKTLRSVRLPSAVPYLLPALRLAAANAVVGAIVAEVSTGLQGGIGRLIIQYAGQASGDPAKAWAPIAGAVALGLIAAGSVAVLGLIFQNYRRAEAPA